ncbi:MAG TPA: isoprenylcysteine carboxylmethyltransferase family protein [Dyella sp.]|uniref:methyltransferase family protein n=1 Tax=Dyella sp. TaxID=1869338 RepID=UPI002D79AF19|nr:isoprenylcysteine carboxylmethyltransferase family protein [Dyella sp.]HET6552426.1 isoprenylcysteine carboxylmethyltransferase family protein [Dyella sp.]
MNTVRNVALVVFFVWLTLDAVVVFRLRTGSAENRDQSSLKLLMIGGPLVYAISIGLSYQSVGAFRSVALQVAGLVVLGLGIALRSMAISQLGRFHTPNVAIRGDHQLKAEGLYAHVRHPSYLGAMIAFLGFALALGNWLSVVVMVSLMACLYLYRIKEEDAALEAAFGEAFRQYAARTKRLVPGIY